MLTRAARPEKRSAGTAELTVGTPLRGSNQLKSDARYSDRGHRIVSDIDAANPPVAASVTRRAAPKRPIQAAHPARSKSLSPGRRPLWHCFRHALAAVPHRDNARSWLRRYGTGGQRRLPRGAAAGCRCCQLVPVTRFARAAAAHATPEAPPPRDEPSLAGASGSEPPSTGQSPVPAKLRPLAGRHRPARRRWPAHRKHPTAQTASEVDDQDPALRILVRVRLRSRSVDVQRQLETRLLRVRLSPLGFFASANLLDDERG